ncbi:unnamed protein product [Spirodela intermedia]|uniref:K Homology domain-containing protein n=1 Tax=Spirodela intermedia TaxID=51605 RepID=A0A7I8IVV9_SPIIN|nr:unnamed protein product [Spirodela intermedia]CAA6661289.1 unnamed protein product [Spirodela intermedia]
MSSNKRSLSHFDNVQRKRFSYNNEQREASSKPVDTIYRILCGSIINELREETHAKIRVADAIPGAEERVIIIYSYLSEESRSFESDQDPENDLAENDEQLKAHCLAQDALLKVHDRIAADELLHGSREYNDVELDETVTSRILVPNNQVGCLLGKGGNIIQKLRSETGANIRILPAEHLPPCAMANDELVQEFLQISGTPAVVRRALYDISTMLHKHPRKENPSLNDVILASTQGLYHPDASIPPVPPMPWHGGWYGDESSNYAPGGYGGDPTREEAEEFSMKIVCSAAKIGGVIGKGGANVKQLQQQTGANVQVENTSDPEERIVLVSSREVLWDSISPTVEAMLQLQGRTSEASDRGITTRLLVPSSKVGCLLGQGGYIITEMRRRTKADIRVYSKDDKPQYASANEELVQITGNPNVARDALLEVLARLRERTLQAGNPAENHAPRHSFHRYSSSEAFSGRGLPPAGMVGTVYSGGLEHLKVHFVQVHCAGSGQQFEAMGFHLPQSSSTGHPIYRSSPEAKLPTSRAASLAADGTLNQMTGAGMKLQQDPLFAYELGGDPSASQSFLSQAYAPPAWHNAPGEQSFQPSQGYYPTDLPSTPS